MVNRVGQQLGNYRLIRFLGQGGFAEVYLGEHFRLKTLAAIKILHTQLAGDDAAGFLNEAQTIAHLEHPHIVRVLDFDVKEGTPFLVMSYASNGTLRQRYPKGTRLVPQAILPYVKQIADALQYAHDEKLIHRDVKPENMLLGRRNEVLLSDFGIAIIAQSSHYQVTQQASGTVTYMAPEQVQGKPRPASDQYALGVVIYEWLCGSRPFQGTFTEVATQHVLTPPPPLHEKVPGISPAIEQVVLKALAKDPHQRFASVQEFASAFEWACQPPISPAPLSQSAIPSGQPPMPANPAVWPNQSPALSSPSIQPSWVAPPSGPAKLSPPQSPKRRGISRRVVLAGIGGLVVVGGGVAWLEIFWLPPSFTGSSGSSSTTITGLVASVNAANGSVTLTVNGTSYTITGLTAAEVSQLQGQVGQMWTITATCNGNSCTIINGTNPVASAPGAPASVQTETTNGGTSGTPVAGSISFIGKVQSVSTSSIVVSMPDGSTLSMSIVNGQTDLSNFNNAPPPAGATITVFANANTDGSYTATKLTSQGTLSDQTLLNTVQYYGVTTSAVGSDNVLHFTVGQKSYSFTIGTGADLSSFNNNTQSIQANQMVKVTVLFNGSNGSVTKVSSSNGQ